MVVAVAQAAEKQGVVRNSQSHPPADRNMGVHADMGLHADMETCGERSQGAGDCHNQGHCYTAGARWRGAAWAGCQTQPKGGDVDSFVPAPHSGCPCRREVQGRRLQYSPTKRYQSRRDWPWTADEDSRIGGPGRHKAGSPHRRG